MSEMQEIRRVSFRRKEFANRIAQHGIFQVDMSDVDILLLLVKSAQDPSPS